MKNQRMGCIATGVLKLNFNFIKNTIDRIDCYMAAQI